MHLYREWRSCRETRIERKINGTASADSEALLGPDNIGAVGQCGLLAVAGPARRSLRLPPLINNLKLARNNDLRQLRTPGLHCALQSLPTIRHAAFSLHALAYWQEVSAALFPK
jgi:hypothetical protein